MYQVYTIFTELLKLSPRYYFDKAVQKYNGDRYVKTFTTWQQYITMLYCQITQKDSLRDIETGLFTHASRRIVLQGHYSKEHYPDELRLIQFYDEERQKTLTFLTNNFKLAASTIAKIYKSRWQIELFFKWIKQNLKIKSFLGTSKNAVLTQIWTAMIYYLLLTYIKYQTKYGHSLLQLSRVVRETLFERKNLIDILTLKPEQLRGSPNEALQSSLF